MFVRVNKYFCKTFFSRYSQNSINKEIPTIVSLQYVKNLGYPTCLDCIHFIPSKWDDTPDLGKCSKFATQELSSGNIELKWASVARIDERCCGPYAKHKETIKGNYCQIVHKIRHPETENR